MVQLILPSLSSNFSLVLGKTTHMAVRQKCHAYFTYH